MYNKPKFILYTTIRTIVSVLCICICIFEFIVLFINFDWMYNDYKVLAYENFTTHTHVAYLDKNNNKQVDRIEYNLENIIYKNVVNNKIYYKYKNYFNTDDPSILALHICFLLLSFIMTGIVLAIRSCWFLCPSKDDIKNTKMYSYIDSYDYIRVRERCSYCYLYKLHLCKKTSLKYSDNNYPLKVYWYKFLGIKQSVIDDYYNEYKNGMSPVYEHINFKYLKMRQNERIATNKS